MEKIPFDDIDALQAKLSQEFGEFGEAIEVTQEMIDQFAELTGDHQWIHVDVERARKESPFGGPIAHGFLTLSLLPKLSSKTTSAGAFVLVGFGNAVNYGSDKLRFLSPVPAGAKVHARMRLAEATAIPKGTRVVQEIAVHVVGSERPAIIYRMITLYQP